MSSKGRLKTVATEPPKNWQSLLPHPLSEFADFGVGIDQDGMANHMKENGYDETEPIVIYEGKILDGRHRLPAAIKSGVTPTFSNFTGTNPVAYVTKKLMRQHLDTSQRAMMAAALIGVEKSCTLKEAADRMNVSPRSVTNATKIHSKGTPELIKAVKEGSVAVDDAVKVVGYPAMVQDSAAKIVRKFPSLTVAEVANFTADTRLCLGGMGGRRFGIEHARMMKPLAIFNRVATNSNPLGAGIFDDMEPGTGSHASWADHYAKLILWRPRFCFDDPDKIAREVDSALYDLYVMETDYASLPVEEAEELAKENSKEPDNNEEGLDPKYWWADMWLRMRPDFSRLTEEDREAIEAATDRYLEIDRSALVEV